ncbi:SRPBCC domain-containing protein [Ruania suaedae]|uniref:SRPBCC domain-containing protein n=1 Tax=Ruania suaedae TaxID=2897774 RepID=UPI001E53B6C0|nr:SRPBCC domain-containing protein [Ruania suaedae]UFU01789.1 SRPBCC domain-containing protein [Ruania suaedae]
MDATGYLRNDDCGLELVFERELDEPIKDVWAAFTTAEGTTAWIGTWSGEDVGEGGTVEFTMNAEESAEPEQVTVLNCHPPHRVQVELASEAGLWRLRVDLQEVDGRTHIVFAHLLEQGEEIRTIGPGWDYYLDRLVAARTGAPMPDWDEYWPALAEHYLELG